MGKRTGAAKKRVTKNAAKSAEQDVEKDTEKGEHNYPALNLWLVLLRKTDAHHGLTAKQMCAEMAKAFADNPDYPNFKTPGIRSIANYKNYLETHQILGTQLRRVDTKELRASGVTDYRPGTYLTPIMDGAVATLIATMLRSSRLNSDLVNETLAMLCNITSEDDALPTLTKDERADPRSANVSMLSVVRDLTKAIAADRAVTFTYASVDVFGSRSCLDELNPHAMTAATRFVDPYAVVVKNDRFYLLGHLHNSAMPLGPGPTDATAGLQCFALDHMDGLRVSDDAIVIHMDEWDVNGMSRHDTGLAPFDPIMFVNERTHMVMGPLMTVHLLVSEPMLAQLRYDYGDAVTHASLSDSTLPGGRATYNVTVRAAERDIRLWLFEQAPGLGAYALAPRSLVEDMTRITRAQADVYTQLMNRYKRAAEAALA